MESILQFGNNIQSSMSGSISNPGSPRSPRSPVSPFSISNLTSISASNYKEELNTPVTRSLEFWNSVANVYSNNQMTTNESGKEIEHIIKTVQSMESIDKIFSIGVADGSRDPTLIIQNLSKVSYKSLKEIHLNDISPEMIKLAFKKVEDYEKKIFQYVGPIQNFFGKIKFSNCLLFIGVYDINYLSNAMHTYYEERKIIGNQITITPIIWNSFENIIIEKNDDKISFDIENWNEHQNQWHIWQDNWHISKTKGFNLCSIRVETDTGFISHYFDAIILKNILTYICQTTYADSDINIDYYKLNDRYVIYQISKYPLYKRKGLITMINNVLGNIETKYHFNILCNLIKFI